MKTCLNCMVTTLDDNKTECAICGSQKFRGGRPKSGYKMEKDELEKLKEKEENKTKPIVENLGTDNIGYEGEAESGEVSIVKWVITFIIMSIPVVNIIFSIVSIVRKGDNESYTNYMKAALITNVVSYVIGLLAAGFMSNLMTNLMYTLY